MVEHDMTRFAIPACKISIRFQCGHWSRDAKEKICCDIAKYVFVYTCRNYFKVLLLCCCFYSVVQSRDFCQLELFQANCTSSGNSARSRSRLPEVIFIQSAYYGRMRIGRCVTRDYGHVGCSVDVLSQVDAMCSGRLKSCQFSVARLHSAAAVDTPTDTESVIPPCPGDLTSYLEASFTCLPGIYILEASY